MYYPRLRDLREDKDLTQQKMADMLKISRSAYSAYENGINAIPVEVIINLSRIFGTSVVYLLEETDDIRPYDRNE